MLLYRKLLINSTLNCLKHLLWHQFLIFLFHLSPCLSELFHSLQFFLCIIKSNMCLHVHCYRNIAMPHKVLKCLRIHPSFGLIWAISVATIMWTCQVWDKKIFFLAGKYLTIPIRYPSTFIILHKITLVQNILSLP